VDVCSPCSRGQPNNVILILPQHELTTRCAQIVGSLRMLSLSSSRPRASVRIGQNVDVSSSSVAELANAQAAGLQDSLQGPRRRWRSPTRS
jgi:hypothetical protein